MATERSWTLLELPITPATLGDPAEPFTVTLPDFLGRGILRPFRRDEKQDYANTTGADLVRSALGQVLGTNCSSDFTEGEMPWRPEFGSLLYLLRHRKNDDVLRELARVHVIDAVRQWEPRVKISAFDISRQESTPGGGENVLVISVTYAIASTNSPGNEVLIPEETATFELSLAA